MFIDKLILQGYTRVAQNTISKIEIDFTKHMQIILGSNGSGKSSLLEQLSLLPPQTSNEFSKGGRKEAHCTSALASIDRRQLRLDRHLLRRQVGCNQSVQR